MSDGKSIGSAFSEYVTTASSDAQMCGQSSGSEAAIHAMRRMFQQDTFILGDAANTEQPESKSTSTKH